MIYFFNINGLGMNRCKDAHAAKIFIIFYTLENRAVLFLHVHYFLTPKYTSVFHTIYIYRASAELCAALIAI